MPGEKVAGTTFDGKREVALFPGDLPADPKLALKEAQRGASPLASFPKFRPPRLLEATAAGEMRPAPHIRLDRALEFLIGDWLQ
jgi:predicted YcjX-like family ATPase